VCMCVGVCYFVYVCFLVLLSKCFRCIKLIIVVRDRQLQWNTRGIIITIRTGATAKVFDYNWLVSTCFV